MTPSQAFRAAVQLGAEMTLQRYEVYGLPAGHKWHGIKRYVVKVTSLHHFALALKRDDPARNWSYAQWPKASELKAAGDTFQLCYADGITLTYVIKQPQPQPQQQGHTHA